MRVIYHWPLDPASRQVRIALAEKKLKFKLELIDPWNPSPEFQALCAEAIPPAMTEPNVHGSVTLFGARAICEYADESSARFSFMPSTSLERAEVRRLCDWFDTKMKDEVHAFLMYERIEKVLGNLQQAPHPPTLREGREYLQFHLKYMNWLLERRDWMACGQFTLADICASAHISCLDFLGEVPWQNWPRLKEWYQTVKSRPSFRPILNDKIPGLRTPRHYANLDF